VKLERDGGKILWEHVLDTAKRLSINHFIIHSDPFAEEFYKKMGAEHIGETASTVFFGWVLAIIRSKMRILMEEEAKQCLFYQLMKLFI
jgi:hypothetical protein